MISLVDTHNHLFVEEFTASGELLASAVNPAIDSGLQQMLICAGDLPSTKKCEEVSAIINAGFGAGVHPLFVKEKVSLEQTEVIEDCIKTNKFSGNLAAIGEIGLDGTITDRVPMSLQEEVFSRFLKMAHKYELPVSIHVRGAIDPVAKYLRRIEVPSGVIHAFNGSLEQAKVFINLGFKLGYGGAFTYSGSKRIRKLLESLPAESIVLETDCPDMPGSKRREDNPADPKSYPVDIVAYAYEAANLRRTTISEFSKVTTDNALEAFPKLKEIGPLKKVEEKNFIYQ